MMRWILAALFVAHGVAHLPGFLVDWKLWQTPEIPYRTTLFAGVLEVGTTGTRVLGGLWLVAALSCFGTGLAMAVGQPRVVAWGAVTLSTLLCLLGLPETRMGLATNAVLAMGLLIL
jgi:hypothetical protein